MLNELDHYVETVLIPEYTRGKLRRWYPAYEKLTRRIRLAARQGDVETVKRLKRERSQYPSRDPKDSNYRRLRYSRYAADIILGFNGPKAEAIEIKRKLGEFLAETLNLKLSEEKTLITHASKERARYLGYELQVPYSNTKLTTVRQKGQMTRRRAINGRIQLHVPKDVIKHWRQKYTQNGNPVHRAALIDDSDFDIALKYGAEYRGIMEYYALAQNRSVFSGICWNFMASAAKTLAAKHKTSLAKTMRKHKKQVNGVKALVIEVENLNNPSKPYRAIVGGISYKVKKLAVLNDRTFVPYYGQNEIIQRLQATTCELCGGVGKRLEAHHIRKLAELKKRWQGRNAKPQWVKWMLQRKRKSIMVCHDCHVKIHAGTYDGKRVSQGQLESGTQRVPVGN